MSHIYLKTPLVYSVPLSREYKRDVYLKLESLQPGGSFKIRGIEFLIKESVARGIKRFVCSSGGNAGIAAAYVCYVLKLPIDIVVPSTTSEKMKDIMIEYGANVITHGDVWDEADICAKNMMATYNAEHGEDVCEYIPPFDHDLLWQGHSTMVAEMIEQIELASAQKPKAGTDDNASSENLIPSAIVVAVGGGGLLCGICDGLSGTEWDQVPIIAAETEGVASFSASIKATKPVKLSAIKSIAVTLGALQVTQMALEYASHRVICPIVVSDKEAIDATQQFAKQHRLLVEPSCGAALAAAKVINTPNGDLENVEVEHQWARHAQVPTRGPIIIVVCGGNNIYEPEPEPQEVVVETPVVEQPKKNIINIVQNYTNTAALTLTTAALSVGLGLFLGARR